MSDMSETLKKMGLFGIGVISLTQEKIEEFTQEMIKKGEMSREEGKKFVKEVLSEKDKQIKDIEDKINQTVKEAIERSWIATKSDIEALRKRIEELERNAATKANTGDIERRIEVLERNAAMRVDSDVLEGRIKELEETIQTVTE